MQSSLRKGGLSELFFRVDCTGGANVLTSAAIDAHVGVDNVSFRALRDSLNVVNVNMLKMQARVKIEDKQRDIVTYHDYPVEQLNPKNSSVTSPSLSITKSFI